MVEQLHPLGGLVFKPTPQTFVVCNVLVNCEGYFSSLLLAWLKADDLVLGPAGFGHESHIPLWYPEDCNNNNNNNNNKQQFQKCTGSLHLAMPGCTH